MKTRYIDLIEQTFDFPKDEFKLVNEQLTWNDLPLMRIIEKHGTPLRITYLPKIGEKIDQARACFAKAFREHGYQGSYEYFYCTKSNHFSYVIDQVTAKGVSLETSSAYDIGIIELLLERGKLGRDATILCNGYKDERYIRNIGRLKNSGINVIPIIDNLNELAQLDEVIKGPCDIGIRIAAEEAPKFEFYTSRLGVGYKDIIPFYMRNISKQRKFRLKLMHFFINTGITDSAYYWNELGKCVNVYCDLKKLCPTLDTLDIGGGLPTANSLTYSFDVDYMITEITGRIKDICDENGVHEPNLFSEFGSFTVADSGATFFSIHGQKKQNEKERWNMIDGSFMTTLPDTWAINKRFIMLPINNWNDEYERVFLGGMTCDSDDYYNSEQHSNAIYLPKYRPEQKQYLGFFNTGAYQDSLGGFGGIQHCLIPKPKHVLIDRLPDGTLSDRVFAEVQSAERMMELLGYLPQEELVRK
ncbi:MAG: arginine decarboxylase [Bacteroidetes bacterium]|nr:arginine decarboxylase [Bacteroidota bacterium]MBX7130091.1 arginine decarboxylase [Flavobacteriales bacterium]MCC6654046.1 arginine decarboxylase [Flavobacteriales bacterium]HMU15235.1 arginine decarboxylase [Flavobacteriales bacterium]HNA31734.1 arginine decarboxylase [Flavobacteriales bacterium]